jgi:hypothetical protein
LRLFLASRLGDMPVLCDLGWTITFPTRIVRRVGAEVYSPIDASSVFSCSAQLVVFVLDFAQAGSPPSPFLFPSSVLFGSGWPLFTNCGPGHVTRFQHQVNR